MWWSFIIKYTIEQAMKVLTFDERLTGCPQRQLARRQTGEEKTRKHTVIVEQSYMDGMACCPP